MASFKSHWRLAAAILIALSPTVVPRAVRAQEAVVVAQPAQPVELSPEQIEAMKHGKPPGGANGPPGGPPGQPGQPPGGKPGEGDKKPEGEGGKKEEGAAVVKRPEKPPRVPDPREFEIKLDDKGRVPPFNFIGQPWPDVMQWLANISKCSLDWQELPNDYLNLTTQRPYSLDEVRDLINRQLNARGYTAIQSGEVLSVFKIDKLDPSLVRRVEEEQLYDQKPYDFVKVSFELPASMEVDKAKDDIKQVLSPAAKVFPLVNSKRILVMDSVANLRTVSELLNQERMVQDGRIVPKEFVLKYARPQQVIEILYVILGVDPKAKPAQTDPQMQAQQMQMMQQMQQQGRDPAKMPKMGGDAPKVYLAFNRQRNSVLANAPPEQMKVIEQTIQYLDVPWGEASAATTDAGATGDRNRTMKKYPLTTLDPDKFVSTLEEIGGLSPYASFKVDSGSKTLFALATADDHKKISSLIDQFDGTGRHFEVIQLRRRPADAVAATIFNLMGGQEKEDEEKNRRRYWSPWDDWGRDDDKKKPQKGFGIDADIENNQLLVWANDAEMEKVRELLVKLGETPGSQRDASRVRVVQPTDAKATAALLEQLRAAWPATSGNKLIIKGPTPKPAPPAVDADKEKKDGATPAPVEKPKDDRAAAVIRATRVNAKFVDLASAGTKPEVPASRETAANSGDERPNATSSSAAVDSHAAAGAEPAATNDDSAPPVTVTVAEDGRLLLSSSDPAALDRMEDLIEQLTPPERRFKIFPLKYIRASEMWYDLSDYFEDDMKGDSSGYTRDWFRFMIPKGNQKEAGTGLSKRRKLMISYDRPSNSIMVANASASQLAEIDQLIKEFDKPARSDSVEIRQTAAIKIQYSRPSVIAAAVKEVYRDLLSSKDKEFDRGRDQKADRSSAERVTVINYGGGGGEGGSDRPSPLKVGFDGALSLGADDISGVLIVSAQKGLFDDIVRMVRELDEQASPKTTVQVHRVNGNFSAQALQKALDKAVGRAWLGNRPEQQPNLTGPEADKKRNEGGRRGGDRNRGENNNGNGPAGEAGNGE